MKIRVGIADDHQLFMKSLSLLISSLSGFEVVCEALNGSELIRKLQLQPEAPDMLLIDVDMPVMDGAQTVSIISASHPQVRMVALSMKEDDGSVIRMLRAGSAAYLLKDIHPDELEKALHEVHAKGYYNADVFNINYRRLIVKNQEEAALHVTDREKEFLQYACSDLTYQQVAKEMHLAERTIDGYRESLFHKLNVKSRTGLAMEALRRGLVKL